MMDDPRLELRGPDNGDALGDIARRIVDGENALASREDRLQQLREAPELVGVKYTVDMVVAVLDLFDHGGLAHHAAAEENFLRRVAVFRVDQRADVAVDAGLGVLADGAGVDDDTVRALLECRTSGSRTPAACRGCARNRPRSAGSRRYRQRRAGSGPRPSNSLRFRGRWPPAGRAPAER